MKNYLQVLKKFEKILNANGWPQTLWITAGMYWDVIIASEGEILPDWRFHPTGEDEGYPYFLIGPTIVRPAKQANSAVLDTFAPTTVEERFVDGWKKNESVDDEFKEKIQEMVEDGDLRVEEVKHEGSKSEKTS